MVDDDKAFQDLVNEIEANSPYKKKSPCLRSMMSVAEMGKLLGLKKTGRYWLVHKNFFKTKTVLGKMWVDIESFEEWYANQIKYHKVTGEEPGRKLKERSYSAREIADMLHISEGHAYEIINTNHLETVTVDYWKRVPREVFDKWYSGQTHFRNRADRERDADIEAATITMPEMARLLGVERNTVYGILKNEQYSQYFETVFVADRKRITRESFERFLNGQSRYRLVSKYDDPGEGEALEENGTDICEAGDGQIATEFLNESEMEDKKSEFLTLEEAAKLAKVSQSTIRKWIGKGYLSEKRIGNAVRLSRRELLGWLSNEKIRMEG